MFSSVLRIQELKDFYISGEASVGDLAEGFASKDKGLTDEMKGQMLMESIKKAAQTLKVWSFIMPFEDGGLELPDPPDFDDYCRKGFNEKESTLQRITRNLTRYEDRAGVLENKYSELKNVHLNLNMKKDIKVDGDKNAFCFFYYCLL